MQLTGIIPRLWKQWTERIPAPALTVAQASATAQTFGHNVGPVISAAWRGSTINAVLNGRGRR